MVTSYPHRVKKEPVKGKTVLRCWLHEIIDPAEFLLLQRHSVQQKKVHKRLRIIRRTSPFLLAALCLPVAFICLLIMSDTSNKLPLCFLFIYFEINILFIDFALWNYYEGKKKLRIWLIEMSLISVAVYFIKNTLF